MQTTRKQLNLEFTRLTSALEEVRSKLQLLDSKTLVACADNYYGAGCNHKFQIRRLQYIETHWYTSPSGCSGGAYRSNGEGQWLCPKCGHRNRLYTLPAVQKLKHLFASTIDTY